MQLLCMQESCLEFLFRSKTVTPWCTWETWKTMFHWNWPMKELMGFSLERSTGLSILIGRLFLTLIQEIIFGHDAVRRFQVWQTLQFNVNKVLNSFCRSMSLQLDWIQVLWSVKWVTARTSLRMLLWRRTDCIHSAWTQDCVCASSQTVRCQIKGLTTSNMLHKSKKELLKFLMWQIWWLFLLSSQTATNIKRGNLSSHQMDLLWLVAVQWCLWVDSLQLQWCTGSLAKVKQLQQLCLTQEKAHTSAQHSK